MITDAITALANTTVTRIRYTGGSYVGGYWQEGASAETAAIVASVQPVSGRDMKSLPEGRRAEESRVIYTLSELRTATPSGNADRLLIDSETYEVVTAFTWSHLGATYYRALVARVEQAAGAGGAEASLAANALTATGTVA